MTAFKFLIDTNIVIGLEDHHEVDASLTELTRRCSAHGVRIFVDRAVDDDIRRDRDAARQSVTLSKLAKFETLKGVQSLDDADLARRYGSINSLNDRSDARLLHCLGLGAADFLITRDQGLMKRARSAGLGDRVLSPDEAVDWLRQTFEPKSVELRHIVERKAYALDRGDAIFESIRTDYAGFDQWLEKCAREHRDCWVVDVDGKTAGLIIRNEESRAQANIESPGRKILKLCTFKMAPAFRGEKFGEQLLKQALWFAQLNKYDVVYLTAYANQDVLIGLLEDYGFRVTKRKEDGEIVLEKILRHGPLALGEGADALAFARDCYPRFYDGPRVSKFVVPIQGDYHLKLFPEIGFAKPLPLFPDPILLKPASAATGESRTPGNTIRKVYLCRAQSRQLKPGDLLFFYLSKDSKLKGSQCLTTVGVVEQVSACSNVEDLMRLTAKRSVFSAEELAEKQNESETALQVIDFLLAAHLDPPVGLAELVTRGIFRNRPPQSILKLDEERYARLKEIMSLGIEV